MLPNCMCNYAITIFLREMECRVCGQWRSFEHCSTHLVSETADRLSDFKKVLPLRRVLKM